MIATTLSAKDIDVLSEALVGDTLMRSKDKKSALMRFELFCQQNDIYGCANILQKPTLAIALAELKNMDAVTDQVKPERKAKKAAKKAKKVQADITPPAVEKPASEPAKAVSEPGDGITFTHDEMYNAAKVERGVWKITKGDIIAVISWRKDEGLFYCGVERGDDTLGTGSASNFYTAIRRAAKEASDRA